MDNRNKDKIFPRPHRDKKKEPNEGIEKPIPQEDPEKDRPVEVPNKESEKAPKIEEPEERTHEIKE